MSDDHPSTINDRPSTADDASSMADGVPSVIDGINSGRRASAVRYTAAVARGRTRLIAGWGLVAVGALLVIPLAWSRWYTLDTTLVVGAGTTPGGGVGYGFRVWCGSVEVSRSAPSLRHSSVNVDRIDPTVSLWSLPDLGPWPGWSTWAARWTNLSVIGSPSLPPGDQLLALAVLMWPLVVLFLAIGTPLLLSARRAKKRFAGGGCIHCGYDFKGLGLGAECPECGKAAAAIAR